VKRKMLTVSPVIFSPGPPSFGGKNGKILGGKEWFLHLGGKGSFYALTFCAEGNKRF
jgi:hypothetical protein